MTKFNLSFGLVIALGLSGLQNIPAQTGQPPVASPTPNLSNVLSQNIDPNSIPRERRAQAYVKLLEAQRYLWGMSNSRVRSEAGIATGTKLARQALQKAVELDPTLSEAYTALAEIALAPPAVNIEEAVMFANIAAKINPDNFGAQRILARVHTVKSRLNTGTLDSSSAQKAIAGWKEITRLDARNAEAWAFLSEFYGKTNRGAERVEALKKWMSAATPLETRFYRTIMGAQESLSPESASVKLGSALIQTGRGGEAVEILSRVVADDPENAEAIDLLRQAIEGSQGQSSTATLESLQQAVFANPGNPALIELLAGVQLRSGKTDDAVKTLQNSIKTLGGDKNAAANLQVSLGDIYMQANRSNEAISAYEDALKTFGIDTSVLTTEDEREFATKVFEKMIVTYKNSGRINEAKATIERARTLLGKADLFSDKQLIALLRESGKKNEALQLIRSIRLQAAEDYSLLRLEAAILTDLGKIDEGVALIKTLMSGKPSNVPSPYYDDFSNYIFISGLYTQAGRVKEAISTAQQAYNAAQSEEKKQIANLTLATAQHQSGDHKSAEETLRNILKKTPGNPIALNNLGYFLLERNERLEEAHDLIEQAVKIDPTNASYLDSLGWANFKLGKLAESEKYLKEAVRYNSSSPIIYEHLGDVYQKQGKDELAKAAWQKALLLSANSEAALRIKAKIAGN